MTALHFAAANIRMYTMHHAIFFFRKIYPIHPKFRLVGVGETHKSSGGESASSPSLASWLSPELLSMFQFHHVKPLPVQQERDIILSKVTLFLYLPTYIVCILSCAVSVCSECRQIMILPYTYVCM